MKTAFQTGDHEALINWVGLAEEAQMSVPTDEHYLPLLYVAAQARPGDTTLSFASRMAASLLRTLNLPELITANLQDYEDRAVALATTPGHMAAVKQRLAQGRATGLLYDTARFARHMEAAYTQMVQRHDAGLPPDHLTII